MHHLGTFLLPLCRGTVVVLDLYHVWASNSCIVLTIPKGKEGVGYTSSAASWSGQGDCLPREEHSELSSSAVRVARTRGCVQNLSYKQKCRWTGRFRFLGAPVPYTAFHFPVLPLPVVPLCTSDFQHSPTSPEEMGTLPQLQTWAFHASSGG